MHICAHIYICILHVFTAAYIYIYTCTQIYNVHTIFISLYMSIYIYIGMIMVALTLLGFHGDFLVATTWWIFWCVNWPWYTTRVFWWFFRGNNPWHLDIEMIMVALRLHGLEAGTEPERSGSGAGTKRIRWFQRFFTVFHGFLACRFAPAFFFSCFLTFFCSFSSFFSYFFDFWIFFLTF